MQQASVRQAPSRCPRAEGGAAIEQESPCRATTPHASRPGNDEAELDDAAELGESSSGSLTAPDVELSAAEHQDHCGDAMDAQVEACQRHGSLSQHCSAAFRAMVATCTPGAKVPSTSAMLLEAAGARDPFRNICSD